MAEDAANRIVQAPHLETFPEFRPLMWADFVREAGFGKEVLVLILLLRSPLFYATAIGLLILTVILHPWKKECCGDWNAR